jgi:gentisate 1,2-dioxygenase
MPTMAAFAQLLTRGFRGRPYRSGDSTIFLVIEDSGRTPVGRTGRKTFEWRAHNVLLVPSWSCHRYEAADESVFFSFSDARFNRNSDYGGRNAEADAD